LGKIQKVHSSLWDGVKKLSVEQKKN